MKGVCCWILCCGPHLWFVLPLITSIIIFLHNSYHGDLLCDVTAPPPQRQSKLVMCKLQGSLRWDYYNNKTTEKVADGPLWNNYFETEKPPLMYTLLHSVLIIIYVFIKWARRIGPDIIKGCMATVIIFAAPKNPLWVAAVVAMISSRGWGGGGGSSTPRRRRIHFVRLVDVNILFVRIRKQLF